MTRFDYMIMVVFLLAICAVGIAFTTRRPSAAGEVAGAETNDHLLAGGKVPWWAAGISYVMALFSTVSLVSTPGEAYNHGLRLYVFEWFAPVTGLLFFFVFMRFYFSVKTYTPFAYLERRFDVRVRALVSSIYLFTRISILAMILYSCSRIFQGMAGWPTWVTVLVVGFVSIVYSTLGGLKAVIWTHVLQFAVMVLGIGAVVVICTRSVPGGASGIVDYALTHDRGFNFNSDFFSLSPYVRVTFWTMLMGSTFGYMFYNSSDQIAIQQLLSTSSYQAAKKSFITSILIFIPLGALLWYLGLAVFAYFDLHPPSGGRPTGDVALFQFIVSQTPQPIPGLMGSAALSAAIATVGAMIMSLATVASKDFYLRFFKPDAGDAEQVLLSRCTTIGIGLLATGMAILIHFTADNLKETLVESNTIWGSIITVVPPVFFLGVISRRCNANHILASIAFGFLLTVVMVIWYMHSRMNGTPISFMLVSMPAFIGTILFGLVAPYFAGERPSREKVANLTLFTLSNDWNNANNKRPAIVDTAVVITGIRIEPASR